MAPTAAQVFGTQSPPSGGPGHVGAADVEVVSVAVEERHVVLVAVEERHVELVAVEERPVELVPVAVEELADSQPQTTWPPQPSGKTPPHMPVLLACSHVSGTQVPVLVEVGDADVCPSPDEADLDVTVVVGAEVENEVEVELTLGVGDDRELDAAAVVDGHEPPTQGALGLPASESSLPTSTPPSHATCARARPTQTASERARGRFMKRSPGDGAGARLGFAPP
jgi:hypothetical protein